MTIPYHRLPEGVQDAIDEILSHRRGVNHSSGLAAQSIIIPTTLFVVNPIGASIGTAASALIWSYMFRTHRPAYRKEYLNLFLALQANAHKPFIRKLLRSPDAHYLCINSNGDIETRKRIPVHLFKLPLGRRVVANPLSSKETIQKWKKSLPKKTKRRH